MASYESMLLIDDDRPPNYEHDLVHIYIPALQIACKYSLHEDLDFTESQRERIVANVPPFLYLLFSDELATNPEIFNSFLPTNYTFPSTYQNLVEMIKMANNNHEVSCSSEVSKVTAVNAEAQIYEYNSYECAFTIDFIYEDYQLASMSTDNNSNQCAISTSISAEPALTKRYKVQNHNVNDEASTDNFCDYTNEYITSIYENVFKGAIEYLIYAPPHSGKTIFKDNFNYFKDTDDIMVWTTIGNNFVLTNIPTLIPVSKYSVAILPSEEIFNMRCRKRGLIPLPSWYEGAKSCALKANVIVYTNLYLMQIRLPWALERGPPMHGKRKLRFVIN